VTIQAPIEPLSRNVAADEKYNFAVVVGVVILFLSFLATISTQPPIVSENCSEIQTLIVR
jgi:hypothetical protein